MSTFIAAQQQKFSLETGGVGGVWGGGGGVNDWPLLMAAVAIATLPVIILFLIGQRQFIEGIATTGMKD